MEAAGLSRLLDFAALDAGGAHLHPARSTIDEGPYRLQIHVPAAFRNIMGVADPISELWTAATDFTCFGHKTEISFKPAKRQFSTTSPQTGQNLPADSHDDSICG
jgi:hypothetical protein